MVVCGICDLLLLAAVVVFRNAVPTAIAAEGVVLKIHLAFSIWHEAVHRCVSPPRV